VAVADFPRLRKCPSACRESVYLATNSTEDPITSSVTRSRGTSERRVAANAALRKGLFGNTAAARQNLSAALVQSVEASGHVNSGWSTPWSGALALGLLGDSAQAGKLADTLVKGHPLDTVINNIWVPKIRSRHQAQGGQSGGRRG